MIARQENLRDIFPWSAAQVRVKRWGKSLPLRQQWWRQGKPRAVQDQIGGESWPGSLSQLAKSGRAPFGAAKAAPEDEPSGRSLDPGREAWTRGMIVVAQARKGGAPQNPAYEAHPLTRLQ